LVIDLPNPRLDPGGPAKRGKMGCRHGADMIAVTVEMPHRVHSGEVLGVRPPVGLPADELENGPGLFLVGPAAGGDLRSQAFEGVPVVAAVHADAGIDHGQLPGVFDAEQRLGKSYQR